MGVPGLQQALGGGVRLRLRHVHEQRGHNDRQHGAVLHVGVLRQHAQQDLELVDPYNGGGDAFG